MSVELGKFEIDPVEPTDFRLAVEGASGTGKTNTLAVFLEDLSGVNIPTLVIERLGVLSTVRKVDDDILIAGGREEDGIDIAVPLEQVDVIVDLVLDRGLKVVLDISTYEDYEGDRYSEHKVVADVLKELNNRSQERLRTGRRRKCLVVIDEVHYLAPERGSQHIDTSNDHVKNARAQIVKIATEGGNKGINLAVAYQRRSYTSKGVVSQVDNYVIHRLHATDRGNVAKEIGVSTEEIEGLGTGEVLIYGDFTKHSVVGPVDVRSRSSPDPREGSFEPPETPESLSSVIEEVQEKITDRSKEETKYRNEVEKLESENERLKEKINNLEEQAKVADIFRRSLENFTNNSETDGLQELKELEERNQELSEELGKYRKSFDRIKNRNKELKKNLDKLETKIRIRDGSPRYEELETVKKEIENHAWAILRKLGVTQIEVKEGEDLDIGGRGEAGKERQEVHDEEGEELEKDIDYLKNEAVLEKIEDAASSTQYKNEHAWDAVIALTENDATTLDKIVPLVDISRSSLTQVLARLRENNIIKKKQRGKKVVYELDTDGLKNIIENRRKKETLERNREGLKEKREELRTSYE